MEKMMGGVSWRKGWVVRERGRGTHRGYLLLASWRMTPELDISNTRRLVVVLTFVPSAVLRFLG
jgi:hypothetical protein